MNKLNKLFAILIAVLGVGSLSAQTDVTSLYLTNADFSQGEPATANIFGYGKDGTPYGLQTIAGWSTYVISGDDSNKSYPNSGMAGAMLAYGSSPQLKGNNKSAPAANPTGNTYGNCLGFMAVWGCGGYYYQEVELLAGDYSLSVDIYNQSGTQNNTSYIGFFVNEGPSYTIPVNPAVGKWVKNSVTFSLAAKTKGKIAIGYQSNGSGSGANPHIFIDNVTLLHSKLEEPDLPRQAEIDGIQVDLSDFNVGTNNYTLVVNGTIGTEIKISAENISYTPSSNGTVRFVKYNNVMYVYEGNNYMGPIASNKAAYTYQALTGADYTTNNLLENPSFETVGTKLADNKYKFGTPWETNVTEGAWGIRIGVHNGSKVVVWRGSGNNNYFSQPLSNLKPFKGYKAYLSQVATGNANANFNIGIGNAAGDYSICSNTIRLGTNTSNGIHELEIGHIENLTGGFFTFKNTSNNTASSGSDPVVQMDWIGLVASDNFPLTGAQSATILYGGAYAPISLDKDKADWETAKNTANEVLSSDDYKNIIGSERSKVEEKLNITPEESVEAYTSAREALYEAIEDLKNAKADYDVLDAEKNIALGLGMSEETIASIVTTDKTGLEALQDLKVAEYNYIQDTYAENATLGSWTEDFAEDLNGEGYKADGPKYFNEWNPNAVVTRTAKQIVKLPAGDYAISCIGRGLQGTSGYLYYKIGDTTNKVDFIMKGNRGRGVDVDGVANFSDGGTYHCNGEGFGWEYRFITFHLDTETEVEIGVSATFANAWVSIYAPVLLTTEASVKALRLTEIENLLDNVPSGYMNAEVESTLAAKKAIAQSASNANTIEELNAIYAEFKAAVDEANASIAAYEKLAGYIDMTKAFSDVTAYQQKYDNRQFTTDEVESVRQELNVMRYNAASAIFTNKVEVTGWTGALKDGERAEQHWSGPGAKYYDANSWVSNFEGLTHSLSAELTLPAGTYVLKAAGRSSADATLSLNIKDGNATLESVQYTGKGDTGYGIDIDGNPNFSEEGVYANDDKGRGWEWEFAKFELTKETTVTLYVLCDYNSIQNRFGSFSDITLWMDDETYLTVNGHEVNEPLAAAKALVDTKPMGVDENAALASAIALGEAEITTPAQLNGAIDALKAAVANANAWVTAYNEAKASLVAALERFEADYNKDGVKMSKEAWNNVLEKVKAAALAKDVTDSYDGFEAAANNLNAALDEAQASINMYANFAAEISYAKAYTPIVTENVADHNAAITDAEDAYNAAEIDDASELIRAMQNFRVNDYEYVSNYYNLDQPVELNGEWTGDKNTANGQHWKGDNTSYYDYNKSNEKPYEAKITVTLLPGEYVLMAAGRAQTTGSSAYIKVNNDKLAYFAAKGNTGYGIDTDGKANFSSEATYANDNKGRGWEYRFIEFTLTEETEVTLVAGMQIGSNSWASVCTPVLYTTPLSEAKNNLQKAIDDAEATLAAYPIGEETFQISENSDAYKVLSQAIVTAKGYLGESNIGVLEDATETLNAAVETFETSYVLNNPSEGQRFYIKVAKEGHAKEGNAVIASLGETSKNNPTGYTLSANNKAKGYLKSESFIFTQVEGNLYNISVERPEGTVYLTYGNLNESAAGWNQQQIQATSDPEKKGNFKIVATSKSGVFKIYNTENDNYIDCQSGGAIYTDTNIENEEFAFELAIHEVSLTISSAGWATLILPFNAELPEDVVAYESNGVKDGAVQLVEATSLVANTPYLIKSTIEIQADKPREFNFSGYGLADKDSYSKGLFVGTYVQKDAERGSYVLQNKNGVVAFYQVNPNPDEAPKVPTVGAYRSYMMYTPAEGQAASPMFRIGGSTGIDNATLPSSEEIVIYDLMGRKVTTMEKGNMYIINGRKVIVK